ncbi:uroporphyrinogen decarboxylase family protein [Candidatus Contubernalis alkaliaceticus]|uniref:uroporphyrinogen decarboxylase family protein n=1 Tax=Candidatus Contubernalis alkaliaceticus TaxID=338645 RepID=UPI001F4BEDF3|nr:uroporphyrinogen decarboxylase family protein [Candidatus Contubernalis alkalaceticus]UNC90861.1 uroporphyrinogen decarboxylase family protein [Candidatus Contubernalis alkalaceticus]
MRLIDYMKKHDRPIIFPWMGCAGLQLTSYTLYDVYKSPEKQLELARLMDKEFSADFVYPQDDGIIFCETLGLPLLKPDYDFPSVLENPIKNIEDLRKLKVPQPYKNLRMSTNLEALKKIGDHFDKPLAISLMGPFTLAVELVGASDFVRAVILNPDFINEILEFTNEVVKGYARETIKAGVKFMCISEPTGVILSPSRFEELVASRLRNFFADMDVWKVVHVCGDTSHLIDSLINCGAEALSLDQVMDMPTAASRVPKEMVVMGNIDPIHVLFDMAPQEVKVETLKLLKKMKNHSNFMLSFGCDCVPGTPVENLKAVMEAGHTPFSKL